MAPSAAASWFGAIAVWQDSARCALAPRARRRSVSRLARWIRKCRPARRRPARPTEAADASALGACRRDAGRLEKVGRIRCPTTRPAMHFQFAIAAVRSHGDRFRSGEIDHALCGVLQERFRHRQLFGNGGADEVRTFMVLFSLHVKIDDHQTVKSVELSVVHPVFGAVWR